MNDLIDDDRGFFSWSRLDPISPGRFNTFSTWGGEGQNALRHFDVIADFGLRIHQYPLHQI